jgi:hypothetical protein
VCNYSEFFFSDHSIFSQDASNVSRGLHSIKARHVNVHHYKAVGWKLVADSLLDHHYSFFTTDSSVYINVAHFFTIHFKDLDCEYSVVYN